MPHRSTPALTSTLIFVRRGFALVVRGGEVIGTLRGEFRGGFTAQKVSGNFGALVGDFPTREEAQQAVERAADQAALEALAEDIRDLGS